MMPSASTILAMQALTPSSWPGHVLSWVSAHLRQAMQPAEVLVVQLHQLGLDALGLELGEHRAHQVAVLPSLRALPLNATTFIPQSPSSTSSARLRSVMCRCASRAVHETPGSGSANTRRPNVRERSSLNP